MSFFYQLLFIVMLMSSGNAWAIPQPTATTLSQMVDLSQIEVTPHELALTQVLSEICPPLLNIKQNYQFQQAYQEQLKFFMPKLNPAIAMQQINNKKEYHNILKDVRSWTLDFPKAENQALCIEFAESH